MKTQQRSYFLCSPHKTFEFSDNINFTSFLRPRLVFWVISSSPGVTEEGSWPLNLSVRIDMFWRAVVRSFTCSKVQFAGGLAWIAIEETEMCVLEYVWALKNFLDFQEGRILTHHVGSNFQYWHCLFCNLIWSQFMKNS